MLMLCEAWLCILNPAQQQPGIQLTIGLCKARSELSNDSTHKSR